MKEELIVKSYEIAKERYAALGVDTDKVLEQMQNFHLSLHTDAEFPFVTSLLAG